MAPPAGSVGQAEIGLETEHRADLAQPETVRMPAAPRGPIASQTDDFELPRVDAKKPPLPILDRSGSLDGFVEALGRTARKQRGAVTRIVYYGDSVVASDFGTATLRRKLQEQFGDAGHGFVLVANPWPAYFHNDVYRIASRGWQVSRIVGPYAPDGLYGLGGVSFTAPPGLRSRVGTAREGTFGRRVSRLSLSYLSQPNGGKLTLSVDGGEEHVIDTAADEKHVAHFDVSVPDGEHTFQVRTGPGMTRLFGFVLERDVPGVVLDAIGIVGARVRFLDKQDDAHWAKELAWRSPSLVVFQFGANESGDGFAYPMSDYHRTMAEVIDKVKHAVPKAGCLIVAAMDRARKEDGRLVTVPVIPHIVKEQAAVADEVGCAFFNTFEAMGGRGSMAKWVARGFGAGDYTHPTSVGAEVLGNWIYRALMDRYERYRARSH